MMYAPLRRTATGTELRVITVASQRTEREDQPIPSGI